MFPSRFVAAAKLFLALCTALTGSNVMGQTLTVTPVRLQIPPKQNATTLTVTNSGATATGIQVRVYDWTQSDGNDQLTTTDAIVVSPPLATIAPGASQVIRLVLRRSPERKEDAYRILLDQIPPPAEQEPYGLCFVSPFPCLRIQRHGLYPTCSFISNEVPTRCSW